MIQKVDTFEYFRINSVKIDIESLIDILGSMGETSITLECDGTIYESLDEIKYNKSAIEIPFEINYQDTTIRFTPFDVTVSGKSSSSYRQKALVKEFGNYVPALSKRPFITYLTIMGFCAFGPPWLSDHPAFQGSEQILGLNVRDVLFSFLMISTVIMASLLYFYHWSRTKVYSSRNGFWVRHKEQLVVGVIVAVFSVLLSYLVGIIPPV
jgi:hypothetical protein